MDAIYMDPPALANQQTKAYSSWFKQVMFNGTFMVSFSRVWLVDQTIP